MDYILKIPEFFYIEEEMNQLICEKIINLEQIKKSNEDKYIRIILIKNMKSKEIFSEIAEIKKSCLFLKVYYQEKSINCLINKNTEINSNILLNLINKYKSFRGALIIKLEINEFPLKDYILKETIISSKDNIFDKVYILNHICTQINVPTMATLRNKEPHIDNSVESLKKLLNEEKNKNQQLNQKVNILQNLLNQKMTEIINNQDEIKVLKEKLARYPFELLSGEKMLVINFASISQDIHYSVLCKNTDIFVNIELKLYNEYPKYSEQENYFTVNGIKINKYKSLEFNNIKDNDIILLLPVNSIYSN